MRTVKHFLETFFRIRHSLAATRSPIGGQLDSLRHGITFDPSGAWYSAEQRHADFACQLLIWNSLTRDEQGVLELKYLPVGSQDYLRTVPKYELHALDVPLHDEGGECLARTKVGGLCSNQRSPGESRCNIQSHRAQQAHPVTFVTRNGEEFVFNKEPDNDNEVSEDGAAEQENAHASNNNYAVVRGTRTVYMSYEAIAARLGLSTHQVLRRIKSAHAKILAHPFFSDEELAA